MKYAWIDKMAAKDLWWFSVALACELLGVSRSGFYDWRSRRSRPVTARELEQQLLLAAIVVEHVASKRRYGSPRSMLNCRSRVGGSGSTASPG